MTDTNLFIGIVIFYTALFFLIGLIPQSDITFTLEDEISNPVSAVPILGDVFEFISGIYYNISGFPVAFQTLLFTPLGGIFIYWIAKFIIYIVPFIGD